MCAFWKLLSSNRNCRYLWVGQMISEIGDYFNTIAVLSLTLHLTGSGLAVGGVVIARVLSAALAGPLAGVLLDRVDRRKVMIASDLIRSIVALCFIVSLTHQSKWFLYFLSGSLMFLSPFFTNGRSAILPTITCNARELQVANALTQTTSSLTVSFGTMLGGIGSVQLGYKWAFITNAISFLLSAWAIYVLRSPEGHFMAEKRATPQADTYTKDFLDSSRYIRSTPLILAIGMAGIGWASGGGAAQVLFTLFGEIVFRAGPVGVGIIWGFAGIGLLSGALLGQWLAFHLTFEGYKKVIGAGFLIHGGAYVLFSLAANIEYGILFIVLSRLAMAMSNVLIWNLLLTHVPNSFRGRVFSTLDVMMQTMMIVSLVTASIATQHYSVRSIGVIAGIFSASTAVFWAWANFTNRLPEPSSQDAPKQVRWTCPS
jgi:MFS family permease